MPNSGFFFCESESYLVAKMLPEIPRKTSISCRLLIFHRFESYFRLLKAFNANKFSEHNWRSLLASISDAFCATLLNAALPVCIVLIACTLIKNLADATTFVIILPMLISFSVAELIVAAMVWKNDVIVGAVSRLQMVIDHSKCLLPVSTIQKAFEILHCFNN